jgi:hypothetical protein
MTKGKTFFQGLSRGCSLQLYIRWFKTTFRYYNSMLVIDLGKPNGEREKKKLCMGLEGWRSMTHRPNSGDVCDSSPPALFLLLLRWVWRSIRYAEWHDLWYPWYDWCTRYVESNVCWERWGILHQLLDAGKRKIVPETTKGCLSWSTWWRKC